MKKPIFLIVLNLFLIRGHALTTGQLIPDFDTNFIWTAYFTASGIEAFCEYDNEEILYYGSYGIGDNFNFGKILSNSRLPSDFNPDGIAEIDMPGYQDFMIDAFKMDDTKVLAVGYSSTYDIQDANTRGTFILPLARLPYNTKPKPKSYRILGELTT